jgi:hypothetical protein
VTMAESSQDKEKKTGAGWGCYSLGGCVIRVGSALFAWMMR